LVSPVAEVYTRSSSSVDSPVIRLGDLFENIGEKSGIVIGGAPAPGRRIIIEATQLMGIARLHRLAWRPLSADERIVLERPGRAISRDQIADQVRVDLINLGMDPDAEIDIPGFTPPVVPLSSTPVITVENPTYDPQSFRFSALVGISASGMQTQTIRIVGRATSTIEVVVTARRLSAGSTISAADVRVVRLKVDRVRPGSAHRIDEVIGKQIRKSLGQEIAISTADIGTPAAVEKNSMVTMLLETPEIRISVRGRALDAAPLGGVVMVVNSLSEAIVDAEVIGPGLVRVVPGAAPRDVDRRTRSRADNALRAALR
jgi:flagella basal body P-ring formation protein FlgA